MRFAAGLARRDPTAGNVWLLTDERFAGTRLSDAGLAFAIAGTASPSWRMYPIKVSTRSVVPTAATVCKVPSSGAGISKVAFSVVISATGSPTVTGEPVARNQAVK